MESTSTRKPGQREQAASGHLGASERPEAKTRQRAENRPKNGILDTSNKSVRKPSDLDGPSGPLGCPSDAGNPGPLADRIARLGPLKRQSACIAVNAPPGCEDRASRQLDCGSWLLFRQFIEGPQNGESRLHAGIHCKLRTCPLCMTMKAAKIGNAYLPKILTRWSENQPARRGLMVTFTVRDHADLRTAFDDLVNARRVLRDRIRQARREGYGPFAGVAGGLGHIEVKRGKGSLWHPHMHELWLFDGRYDWHGMRNAWCDLVGYSAQFNCKLLKAEKMRRHAKPEHTVQQLRKDIAEVIKYPIKFEGPAKDLWDAAATLRGATLLRPFGCLWGVKVPDDLADEPLDWDAWQFVELLYRYAGAGRYKRHAH